jgi:hypothetical protein
VFLYKQVLEIDLGPLEAVRARRPKRLPVVLAPAEMAAVLDRQMARKGVAGVTSPLDFLEDLTSQQIGDAVDATGRRTGGGAAGTPGTPTIPSIGFSESSTSGSERLH